MFATNAAGVKVWSATYQPFGGDHVSTGTLPTNRFPGQWFQSESGLHQNWMRDYDPTTGRYLQPDPLGLIDGASVYGYAGQSPMMNMDPTGECFGPAIALLPACVGAGFVLWGWLQSDECNPYTWEQARWDFFNGAMWGWVDGAAWKGGGAAWKAWNGWRNPILPKPNVTSPKFQNIVDDLYKGTTNPGRVGTGTAADAVRHELTTGQAVGGKFHSTKARDYIRGLENWIKKNPSAPYRDRVVAESLLNDLRNALKGLP